MDGNIVYLDANATTRMNETTIKCMVNALNKGNPSSSHKWAVESRALMQNLREYIAEKCGFRAVDYDPQGDYTRDADDRYVVVFTSCASEANCLLLRSVCESYNFNLGDTPHVVVSAVEHKSILECARCLEASGSATVTYVNPDELGFVQAGAVTAALRENTAIVSIMQSNNETGCINDTAAIAKAVHAKGVAFHTDATQMFGKFPINPVRDHVDAFSMTFHKCYGPPGAGVLAIRRKFLHGYRLCAQTAGSQNYSLRGGTENIPALAGGFAAIRQCLTDRTRKNGDLLALKRATIAGIQKYVPCKTYREYLETERSNAPKHEIEVVFISTCEKSYLPSTLLLSIVKRSSRQPEICNVEIKKQLEKAGVVVGIGSACLTSSKGASHVIHAMGVCETVRKGILRVSYEDTTTMDDIKRFLKAFADVLRYYNG